MSKTTNKFAAEVRERVIRMVVDHERDYPSRWAAALSRGGLAKLDSGISGFSA